MNLIELELLGNKPGDCSLGYGSYVNSIVNSDWESYRNKFLNDQDYCIVKDILNNYFDHSSLEKLSEMLILGKHTKETATPLFENVFCCRVTSRDENILKLLLDNYHYVCKFIPPNKVAEFIKSQSLYNAGKNWKHLAAKGKMKEVKVDDIWYKEN